MHLPIDGSDRLWYLVNNRKSGFYRVNYDTNNWKLLLNQLKSDHTQLKIGARAQLLDDLFNLGRAGLVSQRMFFDAISYIPKEQHIVPFHVVMTSFEYIDTMLGTDYKAYQAFKVTFISSLKKHIL